MSIIHTAHKARLASSALSFVVILVVAMTGCAAGGRRTPDASPRPNIILIMTDDQGLGDLGCEGNAMIRTPRLDQLSREGVRLTQFHVSPVCSPTRSSLMTGRYNYRTGIVDTYMGRSMMYPDEVTIAEVLAASGYRTGIFGKWHLGDNYPLRPIDQGFVEALVHHGGGLAQPSNPPDNGYFDPILLHNGQAERCAGYCSDIFADAAIRLVEADRDRPFFVYLAFNAPHVPLQVADEHVEPYRKLGLDEDTARVYGMVTNIDDNVGRLLDTVARLGLADNTIVVFLTDNGPAWTRGHERYNAGLRGTKGTVYEGGLRVPCFVRWPVRIAPDREVDRIAAHIDLMPTLLDAAGVRPPAGVKLDGVSLLPLLLGRGEGWRDRTLFFQWHRGDVPVAFRSAAVRTQQYKLVDGTELYDLQADPGEQHDVASAHPDVVASLRREYEAWLADVSATRGYAPPRIHLGSPHENPLTLTRQDWRGSAGWSDGNLGCWETFVERAGTYDVVLRFAATQSARRASIRIGGASAEHEIAPGATECRFTGLRVPAGDARVEAVLIDGDERSGPAYVDVQRVE